MINNYIKLVRDRRIERLFFFDDRKESEASAAMTAAAEVLATSGKRSHLALHRQIDSAPFRDMRVTMPCITLCRYSPDRAEGTVCVRCGAKR